MCEKISPFWYFVTYSVDSNCKPWMWINELKQYKIPLENYKQVRRGPAMVPDGQTNHRKDRLKSSQGNSELLCISCKWGVHCEAIVPGQSDWAGGPQCPEGYSSWSFPPESFLPYPDSASAPLHSSLGSVTETGIKHLSQLLH